MGDATFILNHICVGVFLSAIWLSYLSRFWERFLKANEKIESTELGDVSIGFKEEDYKLLQKLSKKRILHVKIIPAAALWYLNYLNPTTFGLINPFFAFIVLPVSFFFAYSSWPFVLFIFILYHIYAQILLKFTIRYYQKKAFNDFKFFREAYDNACLYIQHVNGNAVAWPKEWGTEIKLWEKWMLGKVN